MKDITHLRRVAENMGLSFRKRRHSNPISLDPHSRFALYAAYDEKKDQLRMVVRRYPFRRTDVFVYYSESPELDKLGDLCTPYADKLVRSTPPF